jgi:serine/threonine-protein kinase HipA
MISAAIRLFGTTIGTAAWDTERACGVFRYEPTFLDSGIEVSPFQMPLAPRTYSFPHLNETTFKGLPGMLADALPDKFGNLLIDQWLARQNRLPASFNPIERLCYLGSRAMGALEFEPSSFPDQPPHPLEIDALVELANSALGSRSDLETTLTPDHQENALADILRVGTSAGGASAKAVIAWNPETGAIRSGQVPLDPSFQPWLIKFDGVSGNVDKELADPKGCGRIEYAYHLVARAAEIEMSDCHLLEENGRAHFMTRRFDRTPDGGKLHLQSLCALGHYDFNQAGGYSYEQAFDLARRLGLQAPTLEELYRRAVFNILMRNQDDHTKNISFMMDRSGTWQLAPAYDLTYSYNPAGAWTSTHQMTLAGKRDHFTESDLLAAAATAAIKTRRAKAILSEVRQAQNKWPVHANTAGVPENIITAISKTFR